MKKSLLLSAVSVAGAAALVGGMTFAAFNDYELAQAPSLVAAGTLELDQKGVTQPLWVTNLKPGDDATFTITLKNKGTLDGLLFAKIHEISGTEDGCDVADSFLDFATVESTVDNDCRRPLFGPWTGASGDLVKYLTFFLVAGDGTETPIEVGDDVSVTDIAAGQTKDITLRVHFDMTALGDKYVINGQNDAQGDAATIQLKFALTQTESAAA